MFADKVLREIFGPKEEEVKGDWIKSHNDELNDMYSSPNVIRFRESSWLLGFGNRSGIGCEGHATLNWGEQNCIQSFVRELDAKRQLGKSTRRREYNIK